MADTQQRKISLLLACKMWQYVFRALKLPKDDSEEDLMPLNKLDLYDPESVTVKSLFYIYSMESFIYRVMNSAARDYN